MNDCENLPEEILLDAPLAISDVIPAKSKDVYNKEFGDFNVWLQSRGVDIINEDVLLAYFLNCRKKCVSSSLWKKYSMLKSTLKVYKKVDISKYGKLTAYLRSQSQNYKAKKFNILQKEHIIQFLKEAPDSIYLMTKVALLMGIAGACRCCELVNLKIDDIEDKGSYLYVTIPDTKTNRPRTFTLMQEGYPVNCLELYRKYIYLRPKDTPHRRLFVQYITEKCTKQPVGINTLSKIPSRIASYLQLPEPESYTGHSLRRSSSTLLVNGGGDILNHKRHGGRRSSSVAEGYFEHSISNKIEIAKIQGVHEPTLTDDGNEIDLEETKLIPECKMEVEVEEEKICKVCMCENLDVKLSNEPFEVIATSAPAQTHCSNCLGFKQREIKIECNENDLEETKLIPECILEVEEEKICKVCMCENLDVKLSNEPFEVIATSAPAQTHCSNCLKFKQREIKTENNEIDLEETNDCENLPEEIVLDEELAVSNVIPAKSKDAYNKEFGDFNVWRESRGVDIINEDVLLAYLFNCRKTCVSSSLWKKYSMLKSTLKVYKKVDISKYGKLTAYLRSQSRNYNPKKANMLQKEHITQFLQEAPDSIYLMTKVALLMGIAGACRCCELVNLKIDDIEDKGSYLYVTIPDTKTNRTRTFTLMQEGYPVNCLELYRKYIYLRPKNTPHRRLFVKYIAEKCTKQPVGINTLSKIPSRIASYLQLPEPESFTGHSLRRSSATLLVNGGGDILKHKRHGQWRSSSVAEGCFEQSISNKIEIAKKIQGVHEPTLTDDDNEIDLEETKIIPECKMEVEVEEEKICKVCMCENLDVKLSNEPFEVIATSAPAQTHCSNCLGFKQREIKIECNENDLEETKIIPECKMEVEVEEEKICKVCMCENLDVKFSNEPFEVIATSAPAQTHCSNCLGLKQREIKIENNEIYLEETTIIPECKTEVEVEKEIISKVCMCENLDVKLSNEPSEIIATSTSAQTHCLNCLGFKQSEIKIEYNEIELEETKIISECKTEVEVEKEIISKVCMCENLDVKLSNEPFEVIATSAPAQTHCLNCLGFKQSEIEIAATIENLLPCKSRERYEIIYQKFMDWRKINKINSFSENVLMAYFDHISTEFKPSSLWAIYSMLKTVINIRNNKNIGNYSKLREYLKKKSDGFQSKKSKVLTAAEVNRFIKEAPDSQYILIKSLLIIGICGACRKQELRNLKMIDIEDSGKMLHIKIPDTKTKTQRSFEVSGYFYDICKKYMALRQQVKDPSATYFFHNYQRGKCTMQVVGINKIGSIPKQVAEYLKLENPSSYTGHSVRQISATVLGDAGGDL